jgi:predicted NUDIX family phosphoesterase
MAPKFPMTETLVCLASSHVDALALAEGFSVLPSVVIAQMFEPTQIWLGPRSLLEKNESYRQLVSYVVIRHAQTVLAYRRTSKGGESRLHGRASLGVGGHWNVGDVVSEAGVIDAMATLRRACDRELAEEIEYAKLERIRMVGVIKESGNAVSRVHLGVVIECWLSEPRVKVLDPGLSDARFIATNELSSLSPEMETWSKSLVSYLSA